ncbi:MAG: hypothetical protein AAB530_03295 [Patescibacteria group bacterium]
MRDTFKVEKIEKNISEEDLEVIKELAENWQVTVDGGLTKEEMIEEMIKAYKECGSNIEKLKTICDFVEGLSGHKRACAKEEIVFVCELFNKYNGDERKVEIGLLEKVDSYLKKNSYEEFSKKKAN